MGDRKRVTEKTNTRKQETIPSVMRLFFVAVVICVLLSGLLQVQKTACCAALSLHEPPDTVQLLLETDMRPTETLYLYGYRGGDYVKRGDYVHGGWRAADDDAIFEKIAEAEEILNISKGYYSFLNFRLIELYNSVGEAPVSPLRLTVQSRGDAETVAPYYGILWPDYFSSTFISDVLSYVIETGEWPEVTVAAFGILTEYKYYEQKNMPGDWDDIPQDEESVQTRVQFLQLQEAYKKYAKEVYTQLPDGGLVRLRKLAEENPLTGLDEITEFIRDAVQNRVADTLPLSPEELEAEEREKMNLLLSSFAPEFVWAEATDATLLYRLYGIPARYVTGYRVPAEAFTEYESGSGYYAVVTEASACAWTEIFLENYGWTPIDVIAEGDFYFMDFPFAGEKDPEAGARNTGKDVLFGGILVFVLMLSLLLKIRLQLRPREKREDCDTSRPVCLALLQRLIKFMRFAGVLRNYDGSESDFPVRFAAEVPVISHEEAERFAAVIAKESFGASPPSTQEVEFVHAVCRRAVACLYKKMPWPKKLIFSCRKVF